MSKLIDINAHNLNETLNLGHFINHDHAYDHGAAVTIADSISLFQTNGLGEDLHGAITGDCGHHGGTGLLDGLFHTDHHC